MTGSRYWIAEKEGTAVMKYDTSGGAQRNLPEGIEAIDCDSADELKAIETDASVLTNSERESLGL